MITGKIRAFNPRPHIGEAPLTNEREMDVLDLPTGEIMLQSAGARGLDPIFLVLTRAEAGVLHALLSMYLGKGN